jgi:hypothetical protein
MAISYQVFDVGETPVEIVPSGFDSKKVWIQNLSAASTEADYSRAGYVHLIDQIVTIASPGTALFLFETGAEGAQFEFWNFTSTNMSVLGELIEGATITGNGTAIPAYNLNRNYADEYDAIIEPATALTGGTTIIQEIITAAKDIGGSKESGKIVTLEPSTRYGFRFTNLGNQETKIQAQIAFVEKFNGLNRVYLGPVGNSVYVSGGERVILDLRGDEPIFAVSDGGENAIAVMKAD